jgi:hypothetical protein
MHEKWAHSATYRLIDGPQIISFIADGRKCLHAYGAAYIASNCQYALPNPIYLYNDIAVCPGALAELAAPFGETPICGPAGGAKEIARLNKCISGIVGNKRGFRGASVARADSLIDVDMMGDGALELIAGAKTGFAHDPRYKRR